MSGGAFNYFYFAAEEAMIGHVSGISEMLAYVEQNPDRYDPRTADILRRLRERIVVTQVEIHEANEVLHDIEFVAGGDYSKETLTGTIESYLKKYPLSDAGREGRGQVVRDQDLREGGGAAASEGEGPK